MQTTCKINLSPKKISSLFKKLRVFRITIEKINHGNKDTAF